LTTTVPGSPASPAFVVGIIVPGLDTLLAGILQDEGELAGGTVQLIDILRKLVKTQIYKLHQSARMVTLARRGSSQQRNTEVSQRILITSHPSYHARMTAVLLKWPETWATFF
jgi:hypothetical protein